MTPELEDLFRAWLDHYAVEHRGPQPGRIESYDPVLQVADVQPMLRLPIEQPNATFVQETGPVVPCVPVMFPRVGGWFLSLPVKPGDFVLLVPCEGDWSRWWDVNDGVSDVEDLRRHHLAHCVAIPGIFPREHALTHTGAAGMSPPPSLPSGMVIGSDDPSGPRILLKSNGDIEFTPGTAASQPFVKGTTYADALGTFLDALSTVLTAVGTFASAVPGASAAAATLNTAIVAATTAITAFKNARTTYLSTKIRGA